MSRAAVLSGRIGATKPDVRMNRSLPPSWAVLVNRAVLSSRHGLPVTLGLDEDVAAGRNERDRPAPDRPVPDRPAPDRPVPDRPVPDRNMQDRNMQDRDEYTTRDEYTSRRDA
jgi:hypothetical protein